MKKTVITTLAFLVLFGFTITGAMAQTWTWDGPYDITPESGKYIEIAADPNDDVYLVGLIDNGGIGQIPTAGTAVESVVQATDISFGPVVDLIVGPGGVVYVIDKDTVGTREGTVFQTLDQQPNVPEGANFGTGDAYKSIAAGKNGKLYVLFETAEEQQYLLVGNPPFTAINATVRFTPRSLNLGSKGKWVSCSVDGLPEGYAVDWANPEALCITAINDDTEVEGLPICREDGPVNTGTKMKVKFSRQDLATAITNAGSPSSVTLTVTGYASAGEEDFEFTGTDTFKTKAKKVK